MNWKYAMILIQKEKSEHEDEVCELVEVFQNEAGEYTSFSKPFLSCINDLNLAHKDVNADGVNCYFYDNGTFAWSDEYCFWDWKKNEE